MTVQISQRGKAYLETARTLLRAAKTMTDSAIAGQLKALADDYQRRAEKASHCRTPYKFGLVPPKLDSAPRMPGLGAGTFPPAGAASMVRTFRS